MISIVVPMFNAENTVYRCVESIQKQIYEDFELILIDDGSTDNTKEICKDFIKNDSRVRYFWKENGGAASARNMGLQYVSGDYVTFVDVDDEVTPEYLKHLFQGIVYAELSMTDMIVKQGRKVLKRYRIMLNSCSEQEVITKTDFLTGVFDKYELTLVGNVSGKLFDMSIVREKNCRFNELLPYGEELTFVRKYMQNLQHVYVKHSEDYIYYTSIDATSLSSRRYQEDHKIRMAMANGFIEMAKDARIDQENLQRYYTFFSSYIVATINNGFLMDLNKSQIYEIMKEIGECDVILQKEFCENKNEQLEIKLIRTQKYAMVYGLYFLKNTGRKVKNGLEKFIK